jgi:Cu(I)-responsive transcriptional regulator
MDMKSTAEKDTLYFTIGEAASESGISAKMIRHYEQVGLLKEAARTLSGYRLYNQRDVHVLRFIRHSRDLGFSIKQIEELLALWQDRGRPSREVKKLAQSHLNALNDKIRELNAMKSELERLVNCCKGDARPDCPILDGLAS